MTKLTGRTVKFQDRIRTILEMNGAKVDMVRVSGNRLGAYVLDSKSAEAVRELFRQSDKFSDVSMICTGNDEWVVSALMV